MKKIIIGGISAVILIIVLVMAGCGGGNPAGGGTGGGTGVTVTASQYVKLTPGNTWTYNLTDTTTGGGATMNGIGTYITTCGAVVPASGTTVTNTSSLQVIMINGAPVTGMPVTTLTTTLYEQIDGTGKLMDYNPIDGLYTWLPATFSIGTTWTVYNSTTKNITGKIAAINITKTVAAGIFNDVIQVDYTGTDTTGGITTTVTGTTFYSKIVGMYIYTTQTTSSINGTSVFVRDLKPGYIAL